ncbi:hypothetical protein ES332_A08G098500v1 [Gossypium tomentosum]|uniref:Uncharacterized protein n=1 Tax=Gossypium tomentosum TaxID=34277 RepID=A0A5D2PFI6_GOSTO|nr:hypothetical protein ES332_A08G098500v1 [Gossypium tomentosum]
MVIQPPVEGTLAKNCVLISKINEGVLVLESKRVNEGLRVLFSAAPFHCAMTRASTRFGRPGMRMVGGNGEIARLIPLLCARPQFLPLLLEWRICVAGPSSLYRVVICSHLRLICFIFF